MSAANFPLRLGIHLAAIAAAVYLNLRVLLPHLLEKRHYVGYALAFIASMALILTTYALLIRWNGPPSNRPLFIPPRLFIVFFIHAAVLVLASSAVHVVKRWMHLKNQAIEAAELGRRKLEAELVSLRAQLNPHFLFNALNNLYALSLDESPKAPQIVLKLADLMRYILYECQSPRVALEKEVAFVQNYLELERLRVDDKVTIDLKVIGTLEGQRVAPLLFMPLVENAFKHGVGHRADDAFVHVLLHIQEDDTMVFRVENSTAPTLQTEPDDPLYGGIGLQNIQKRLALLYPDVHQFETTVDEKFFRAQLTVPTH
ncbi:MAG: histidine kinase [Rhodothermales bacterium]